VRRQSEAATALWIQLRMIHPPATAGGTDLVAYSSLPTAHGVMQATHLPSDSISRRSPSFRANRCNLIGFKIKQSFVVRCTRRVHLNRMPISRHRRTLNSFLYGQTGVSSWFNRSRH